MFEHLENAVADLSSLLIARKDATRGKRKEVSLGERQRTVIKHLFGESFVKSMESFKAKASQLEEMNARLLLQLKSEAL